MLCKFCKSNTIVIDGVDNRDTDETYRQRVCTKCGRAFYTVEFPVEVDKRFKNDWAVHHKNGGTAFKGSTYYTTDGVKLLIEASRKHKAKRRNNVK